MSKFSTPDDPLSFIAEGEANSEGYNSANNGTSGRKIIPTSGYDLTNMTFQEVMDLQKGTRSSGRELFAVGRYQIIPDTMKDVVKGLGIDPRTTKFDEAMQDRAAMWLMTEKRPKVGAYIRGESDDIEAAMLGLAKEWASFPDPKTGNSYYGSGNRAKHSVEDVRAMLQGLRDNPGGDIPKLMESTETASQRSPEAELALANLRGVDPVIAGFIPDPSREDIEQLATNIVDRLQLGVEINKEVITSTIPAIAEKISEELPSTEDITTFVEEKSKKLVDKGLKTATDLYKFITSDQTNFSPQHLTAWAYYLGVYSPAKKLGIDLSMPSYTSKDLTPEELAAVKQAIQSAKEDGRNNIAYKDWGGEDEAWTGFAESSVGKNLSNPFYAMKNFLGRARVEVKDDEVYVVDTYNFNKVSQDAAARKLWEEGDIVGAAEQAVEDGGSIVGGLRILSGIIGAEVPEDLKNVEIKVGTTDEVFGGASKKSPTPRARP